MRGTGLVLLFFLLTVIFHYSRWALPEREGLPAVVRLQPQLTTVEVVNESGRYGLYQFNDGSTITDVIKLTHGSGGEIFNIKSLNDQTIIAGESIKAINLEGDYVQVECSWLSARHRILLQIPLHPDRMRSRDWESLPGIGPRLAELIEIDRQKNGDFVEFTALKRVKGIGSKKLEAWKEYFEEKKVR